MKVYSLNDLLAFPVFTIVAKSKNALVNSRGGATRHEAAEVLTLIGAKVVYGNVIFESYGHSVKNIFVIQCIYNISLNT